MRHGIRNPNKLKLRHYSSCIVDINEYFTVFPGGKASDNLFLDRNKKNYFEQYYKWME